MKLITRIVLVLLMFAFASPQLYADEKAKQVDIANIVCDQSSGQVMLKYVQSNDDFFSQPILPKSCKLNNLLYKVTGKRAPYSESRCGAEPPVSIYLSRNGVPIISDAVFGGNCFGGPSIAEIEITEQNGRINSISAYSSEIDHLVRQYAHLDRLC